MDEGLIYFGCCQYLNFHALDLVEGVPVLAGLLHLPPGLDLLSVASQLLADGSLSVKILVGGAHLAVFLNLTLNPESEVVIELLADGPPGGQVLVVGAGLCLLGFLLLPLLHRGLVSLLVVGDGLDNVLPPPSNWHVVALHLALVLHLL